MNNQPIHRKDLDEFSSLYLSLRQKEGRLLTDDQLRLLPFPHSLSPSLKLEWKQRADNMKKLSQLLKTDVSKGSPILDLGCGNGWMSNAIAQMGFETTGMDINRMELEQAQRVFVRENLEFIHANIFEWEPIKKYKAVVIGAALHYFPSPKALFDRLFSSMPHLQSIFICETHFYSEREKEAAKNRSFLYYKELGSEQMISFYHHFSLDDLGHEARIRVAPSRMKRFFNRNSSLFPIIEIRSSK